MSIQKTWLLIIRIVLLIMVAIPTLWYTCFGAYVETYFDKEFAGYQLTDRVVSILFILSVLTFVIPVAISPLVITRFRYAIPKHLDIKIVNILTALLLSFIHWLLWSSIYVLSLLYFTYEKSPWIIYYIICFVIYIPLTLVAVAVNSLLLQREQGS